MQVVCEWLSKMRGCSKPWKTIGGSTKICPNTSHIYRWLQYHRSESDWPILLVPFRWTTNSDSTHMFFFLLEKVETTTPNFKSLPFTLYGVSSNGNRKLKRTWNLRRDSLGEMKHWKWHVFRAGDVNPFIFRYDFIFCSFWLWSFDTVSQIESQINCCTSFES